MLTMSLLAVSLLMSSCSKDDEDSSNDLLIPSASFLFSYNSFVLANGEALTINSLELNRETSSPHLTILDVRYFLDGKEIGYATSAPFAMSYTLTNLSLGYHTFTFKANVKGNGYYKDTEFTSQEFDVKILSEPFVYDYDITFDDSNVEEQGVANGEVLSGFLTTTQNPNNVGIQKVEYYWDDALISATTEAPYQFFYKIQNQSVGKHSFIIRCHTSTRNDGIIISRKDLEINVTH